MEVFLIFLRLGCTSFGGPVAHLGYFRAEFVERCGWLSEVEFAEILALAQALPGPASSQTGYAIGLRRAGWLGGLAAWTGFTLPSAALMLAFAFGHLLFNGRAGGALLHGLQLAAVAVVAQAALAMQRSLAPDWPRWLIALAAAAMALLGPPAYGTLLAILLGAAAGLILCDRPQPAPYSGVRWMGDARRGAVLAGTLFVLLLAASAIPFAGATTPAVFLRFYQAGALVFGGGHVVLPALESAVVARGWIGQPAFLAGYGAAQALPGPLFTFAAYLGAAVCRGTASQRLAAGLVALAGIFLPGLLLVSTVLPFWTELRARPRFSQALAGVNAAVVGVLGAALIRPVWSGSVHTGVDLAVVLAASLGLTIWKLPPGIVVIAVGVISFAIGLR
ncbi:chromate transporter [Granulicella rosea]|uniref:Chromate transporter n=1 Tax=Granulicella rosea TaxID=474952 RepID=A0A239CXR7_9BACT|nr:chromate efflux transporter [Granulicella rosea]SNS24441.1 chromate transporter [Granulicella rosea]